MSLRVHNTLGVSISYKSPILISPKGFLCISPNNTLANFYLVRKSRHVTTVVLTTTYEVMEDFQTGEETSFAVDEVSGIIKDVSDAKYFSFPN